MTDSALAAKTELLNEIERSWAAFNAALDRLSEAQLTGVRDAQGWSAKDHLSHLAAWEHSVIYLLQGRPRHAGLGVDEAVYLAGDEDEINASIQRQQAGLPLGEVIAQFRATHQQLMEALQPLTGDALQLPYHHYLPAEADDHRRVIELVAGNTTQHFADHLAWIEALAAA